MLPLHYACLVLIASIDIVSYLIECYPEAVRVPDCHNRLPLHIACHQNTTVPIETIEYLVRAWPHSVQVCYERNPTIRDHWDGKGGLPLDVACASKCPPLAKLIRVLTNDTPPLHFACTQP